MAEDRKTAIFGDQIEDGTIQPREFDTVQQAGAILIPDNAELTWNENAQRMDWKFKAFGTETLYTVENGITSTTSLTEQNKLNYTTPVLPAGTYRYSFVFEALSSSNTHGFVSKFYVDATEYNYINHNHDNWISYSGFVHVQHVSSIAHTIRITIASDKLNKQVSIRRVRLEIWRIS